MIHGTNKAWAALVQAKLSCELGALWLVGRGDTPTGQKDVV